MFEAHLKSGRMSFEEIDCDRRSSLEVTITYRKTCFTHSFYRGLTPASKQASDLQDGGKNQIISFYYSLLIINPAFKED